MSKYTIAAIIMMVGATVPAWAESGDSAWIAPQPMQKASTPVTQTTPAEFSAQKASKATRVTRLTVEEPSPVAPVTEAYAALSGGSVHQLVTQYAQKHGVPVAIAHAVVKIESGYNPSARNGIHRGLMQVSTRTARGLGCSSNLYSAAANLDCGMAYLKQGIAKYGAGCGGISSYNTGNYKTGYCTGYGRKVLAMASRIGSTRVASN